MKTWEKLTRQLLLALSSSTIYKWFDLVGLYLWILLWFLSCTPLLKIIVIVMSFKLNKAQCAKALILRDKWGVKTFISSMQA